jgi:diguanylate cyclase (GGDEF)-like protein
LNAKSSQSGLASTISRQFQRIFRWAVILLSIFSLLMGLRHSYPDSYFTMALLSALVILSRFVPVAISLEKPITFTSSTVFVEAILVNSEVAGISAFIACLLSSHKRTKNGRLYAIFLGAQYSLSSVASRSIYRTYSQSHMLSVSTPSRELIAICISCLVFIAVNAIMVAMGNIGTRFAHQTYYEPVVKVQALAYAVSFPLAIMMILAYKIYAVLSLPILAALLLVCAHAVRVTIENKNLMLQMWAMNSVGKTCASGVRADMPLERFLSVARELIAFDSAILWVWDETNTNLVARQISPERLALPDSSLASPESLIYRASQRTNPLIIPDISREPRQPGHKKPGSWMLYPIMVHGRSIGVAQFIRHISRPFTRIELQRIAPLIPQLAIAYESVHIRYLMHRYQDMAITDGLTGLLNHRRSHEVLLEEIKRAERYHRPLSILMLDVDSFKQFNDTYGHPQGDAFLCTIAHILRSSVRNVDHVGRYGGEEFLIILPETVRSDAFILAERIRESVANEEFIVGDGSVVRKTISIGVSAYPMDAASSSELVQLADEALYRAKRSGKNCVLVA